MPMLSMRAIAIPVLIAGLCLPLAAEAAPVTVITKEIRAPKGVSIPVTPTALPTLSVGEAKGGASLALSYRNMPAEAYFAIVRARDNRQMGNWAFPADADADGHVNAGIPASLPRGVYALRALDPLNRHALVESNTFRANGRGKVSLVSKSHREATLRIFIGTNKYQQTFGATRSEAKKACHKAKRAAGDAEVLCIWDGRTI